MAPDLSLGALAFVELNRPPLGLLAPTLLLAVEVERSPTSHTYVPAFQASGAATFTRILGRVQGCPLRFASRKPAFGLLPCLLFEGGLLTGAGSNIPASTSQRDWWLAPGAALRIEWKSSSRTFLALDGFVTVPLVRDHFYFSPGTTIYSVPVVALGSTMSAALTLP
ncbi:MAG TPA: hypothetical protein VKP30_12355 [Polyangiaceae bacterium]|nr:hypothetical protein [Polyangiaceae bacterium]